MATIPDREVFARHICELAAEQAAVNVAEVSLETHLFNDLNFDSLDSVEFVMKIEDAFDIHVPDDEAERVLTIGHTVELLCGHLLQTAKSETAHD